jgi:hypothetical protein
VGLGEFSDVSSQRYVFGWDPRAKAQLFRFPLPSKNCDRVWLSPDGKTVVVYSSTAVGSELKYRFYFLETASGKVRHVAESKAGDPHASLFEFGHERLAAVAMSSCIMLIDPLSGEELRRLDSDQRSIRALAFSADHKLLASADGEVTTLIWDSSGALPRPVTIRLTDKELALHWADLLSDDAGAAYCAICRMSLAPEQTVAFIKDRVQPAKNLLTAEKLKALADYLDSDRYTEREKASAELMRLGELARDTLEEVRKSPPSLEAKHRAEIILKKLQEARENGPEGLKGEPLREARIVEILERIGSAEARAILKRYAVGAPGTVLSREATASIQRMTK